MATGYIMLDSPNPYQPQGTLPRRGGATLSGTAIIHTSEGNWRNGVDGLTGLVRSRADWGCYHRACDWQDIALYYPWEWETWQDTETNNWAVGISAACKTSDWGNMPADVEEGYYRNLGIMAADFVKYMNDVHGIKVPLRHISGAQARARVPGFTGHGESGINRSDPGANFDWSRFFRATQYALDNTSLSNQGETNKGDDDLSAEDTANIRKLIEMNVVLERELSTVKGTVVTLTKMLDNVGDTVKGIPAAVVKFPITRKDGAQTSIETEVSWNQENVNRTDEEKLAEKASKK